MSARIVLRLAALSLVLSGAALAQQPLIQLDAPAAPTAVSPPSGGDAPQILLPPPEVAPVWTDAAQSPPEIPERDRAQADAPVGAREWLLPLVPRSRLREEIRIGASLSRPGILRLTGEVATIDLALDLPPDATIPDELVLTLQTTVNVLPEVAEMEIRVNGAAPVTVPLDRQWGFSRLSIPSTGLVPGANVIRLDLRQPHRIYCGPEASFAVWTEIDLTHSGAPLDPTGFAPDAGFAIGLRAHAAAGLSLPVLSAADEDPAVLRAVAQALGATAGGGVSIQFRSFYDLGPPAALSVAVIRGERSHAEYRVGAGDGLVLQIEHAAGALPELGQLIPRLSGSVFGAREAALAPGRTTTFAELGQPDIIGNTRHFQHEVPFLLPPDWLLLANQKARLDLRYGFAEALPEGSVMLVRVNGETIRLLPLDRGGGRLQETLAVIFDANLLHGGRNALSFEMMVPGSPPDAVCAARRADMLVVASDSTLTVPPAPAMALAGIAAPLAGLGPGGITTPPSGPDRPALELIAAQLAAGLSRSIAPVDPAVRLFVTNVSGLGDLPLDRYSLSARQVQEVLSPADAAGPLPADGTSAPPRRQFRLTEDEPQSAPAAPASPAASATRSLFGPDGWIARQGQRVALALRTAPQQALAEWLDDRHGIALILRPDAGQPGDLWLLLGPQPPVEAVQRGLGRLRESGLVHGDAVLLGADGSWQFWTSAGPPELHEPLTLSNLRAVLGNYASWSPLAFAATIIGLALLSAVPALLFIIITRRRWQL